MQRGEIFAAVALRAEPQCGSESRAVRMTNRESREVRERDGERHGEGKMRKGMQWLTTQEPAI